MKVNFSKIVLKDIEGNEQSVSVAADLGNNMYMRGDNIEECELGKRIYDAGKSKEDVELTDDDVSRVKKFLSGYSYIVRKAIEDAMA